MAANTYTLISSNVLASSAATVTFSSIPSTCTDLVLKMSVRSDAGGVLSQPYISFNGVVTGSPYSGTIVYATGTTTSTFRDLNINLGISPYYINGSTTTTNTFTSSEIYIPSYTLVQNKPMSFFTALENNSATSYYVQNVASLSRVTAAITSITLSTTNFVSGSSFYLYGIKNS